MDARVHGLRVLEDALVYLNGTNVSAEVELNHDDRISIGHSHFFKFRLPLKLLEQKKSVLTKQGGGRIGRVMGRRAAGLQAVSEEDMEADAGKNKTRWSLVRSNMTALAKSRRGDKPAIGLADTMKAMVQLAKGEKTQDQTNEQLAKARLEKGVSLALRLAAEARDLCQSMGAASELAQNWAEADRMAKEAGLDVEEDRVVEPRWRWLRHELVPYTAS